MCAPRFHDIRVIRLDLLKRIDQLPDCRDQPVFQRQHRRNVHGSRKCIVGGLAHIDVVIRMAELLPCDLIGPVRDDFVGIHIRLGAGSRLPDDERKFLRQFSVDHLIAGFRDRGKLLFRHPVRDERMVGPGRGFLQNTECVNDLRRHGLDPDADREVFVAALGLGSPEPVGRDPDFAH